MPCALVVDIDISIAIYKHCVPDDAPLKIYRHVKN
jgi:hypothetical protein